MNTYPFKQRRIDPLISFNIQNLETDTLSSTDVTATTLVATNANITSNVNLVTNIQGGTIGQIPYQTSSGTTSFFGPGTSGQVYKTSSTTLPTTSTVSMSTNVQNILPVSKGGTGSSSLSTITVGSATKLTGGAIGSLPAQSATDTTTFVSPGAANTSLVSQGVSSLPTYQTIGSIKPTVKLYTTSPSTTNYQPAANVKWIEFYVIGPGGGAPIPSTTARLGAGGGSGAILYHILSNVPQLPTGTITLSSSLTTFDINSLSFLSNNGLDGTFSTTAQSVGGNSGNIAGTTPMIRCYGEAGSASDNINRLGGGGSSMFGTGGRQFFNTTGGNVNGENGSGLGGGGGCCLGTSATRGIGSTGGVVIIEHY